MTKYRFEPAPEIQGNAILPASRLAVYESNAVPGAISVTMSRAGAVQAGTRLTPAQAAELATALITLIGEEEVDPFTLGKDIGYAAGYKDGEEEGLRVGYDDGYSEGDSEGWENGYALGLERGAEGVA